MAGGMVCSVADPRRQTGIFFSEGVIGYWKNNGIKNRFAARLVSPQLA
jgi:hypothetical protein